MSQIFKDLTTGPVPPTVAEQFTTDDGSLAIPAANNLNVLGGSTSDDNDNGIDTIAIANGSDNLFVRLTNRLSNSVTTTDDTPTTINSLDMGGTAATYIIEGRMAAFESTTPAGAGYTYTVVFRTDGVAGTEISGEFTSIFEEAALVNCDIEATVSGNNIVINVEGLAGTTINWKSEFLYTKVE